MWEKALEIASRLTHPISLAAFSLAISAFLFGLAHKSKIRRGTARMFYVLLAVITLLGLAPLVTTTYLQARGVYHVRIRVIGIGAQPVSDAKVTSLIGGEIKKAAGTWELDIAPQTLPANRKLTVAATVENDFLEGSADIDLGEDYFPSITILLRSSPSVVVRGSVQDQRGRPVADASVTIEGYPEIATTDKMGNFEIHSHKARGQMLTIVAQKAGMLARKSVPAGDDLELVLRNP